jgi:mRNA interferase RelE/StbE
MTFKIIWDRKALDFLDKLDSSMARRIIIKVKDLAENPFSRDVKRLKGQPSFRLRVGDYRVIFDIIRDAIIVLKVGHRKSIYDY